MVTALLFTLFRAFRVFRGQELFRLQFVRQRHQTFKTIEQCSTFL
jgi:hypothetical protein